MQSDTVKIGMVGAGFMGQLAHLENYINIPGCKVVALAELRPQLRESVCRKFDIPRSYESHLDLLKDPEVEAVVVVTKRPVLGPIAYDCLRAGKHVITEKPMAASSEQALKLTDIAKKNDLIYAVGYMRRHDLGVQRAKLMLDELIESKELGPIVFVRSHCFQGNSYCNIDGHIVTNENVPDVIEGWPIAPNWIPENRRVDYAWFLNVFCHNFNLIRYLLGKTPRVDFARLDYQKGRCAVLDFGGFISVFQAGYSSARAWDEFVEIHFEHGRLLIEMPPNLLRNVPARVVLYKQGNIQEVLFLQIDWSWAFKRQAEAFVKDVHHHEQPLSSAIDAVEDIKLIEEIWCNELSRSDCKVRKGEMTNV